MRVIDSKKLIHAVVDQPDDGFAGFTYCLEEFHWPHSVPDDEVTTLMEQAGSGEDDEVAVTCFQCLGTTEDAALKEMERRRDYGR
jgi:hypothetical protein